MSQKTKNSAEFSDSVSENQITQETIDQRLLVDFHLTKDEVIVIRKAYRERRKELFRATRQELQDFINKDYRAANEEAL